MPLPITYYDPTLAQWPDLARGAIPLAPVRVGMDRFTGKMLIGWPHVRQSMATIFATRFHERVLRRWVGSFVPHLLGESAVPRIITRFYWAIASAIDLWEPCYAIQRVRIMNRDGTQRRVAAGTTDIGRRAAPRRSDDANRGRLSPARAPWRFHA